MAGRKLTGVSCWKKKPDYKLMKEAGINAVRLWVPFPFADPGMRNLTDRYKRERANVLEFIKQGFSVLLITPLYGHIQPYQDPDFLEQFFRAYTYDKPIGNPDEFNFYKNTPEWMGDYQEDGFYEKMMDVCEFIGKDFKNKIDYYQISGEMDIERFKGPMSADQAIRYLNASAKGIKKGDPQARIGINTTSQVDVGAAGTRNETANYFYKVMYSPSNEVDYDYAGMDNFFGCYHHGKPTDWYRVIDEVYDITRKPILVNEWGYSSLGGVSTTWPEAWVHGTGRLPLNQNPICAKQEWPNAWAGAHNEDVQAAAIDVCLKIFADHPRVIGSLMYDWQDDLFCFCRRAYCPHECGFGLLNREGEPKKSYFAFKNAVGEYYRM